MEENLVQQLIDLVTKTAPDLWRIGRLQVLSVNIQDFIIAAIFVVVSIIIFNLMKRLRDEDSIQKSWNAKKEKYDYLEKEKGCIYRDEDGVIMWKIIGWIIIIILSIFIMCNVVSIIMCLVNPDYYALEYLINLVKSQ